MATIVIIVVPILFTLIGLLAALSFAAPPPAEKEAEAVRAAEQPQEALRPTPIVLTGVRWQPPQSQRPSVETVLASVESQLREEQVRARAFAADPSSDTLWAN